MLPGRDGDPRTLDLQSPLHELHSGEQPEVVQRQLQIAYVWVEKAKKGSVSWVRSCDERQLVYYRLRKQLKPLWYSVSLLYLLLAFFETPSWCIEDGDCRSVPNSGLPQLPRHAL